MIYREFEKEFKRKKYKIILVLNQAASENYVFSRTALQCTFEYMKRGSAENHNLQIRMIENDLVKLANLDQRRFITDWRMIGKHRIDNNIRTF